MKTIFPFFLLPCLLALLHPAIVRTQTGTDSLDLRPPATAAQPNGYFTNQWYPNLLHLDLPILNTIGYIGIGVAYERSILQLRNGWQFGAAASASRMGGDFSYSDVVEGPLYKIGPKLYHFNGKRAYLTLDLQYLLYIAKDETYSHGYPVTYYLHGGSGGIGYIRFKKRNPHRFCGMSLNYIYGRGPKAHPDDHQDRYGDLKGFELRFLTGWIVGKG